MFTVLNFFQLGFLISGFSCLYESYMDFKILETLPLIKYRLINNPGVSFGLGVFLLIQAGKINNG